MIKLLGVLGAGAGAALIALLALNLRHATLQFWPTPSPESWQSFVFWGLFRALNVAALAVAAIDWRPGAADDASRVVASALAACGGIAYLMACIHLGRDNLYCGRAGLVTSGIYGWSRNPQYALAMPTYVALAFAAQSTPLAVLAGMLVAVYLLMALGEEPWLAAAYGTAYGDYCANVPRFYNVRRALSALPTHAGRWPTAL